MSQAFRRLFVAVLGALVASIAVGERAQAAPEVRLGGDLSGGFGPASGTRIAAEGPQRLTVAWCVSDGPAEGVYLRRRESFLWDATPTRIAGDPGSHPRDVYLIYDDQGRVQIVWTALAGGRRRVFHSSRRGDDVVLQPSVVNPQDDADADLPLVVCMRQEAIFVAWQSSRQTHFTIESVALDTTGRPPLRLAPLSGVSAAALSPQVVQRDPVMIAYLEVLEAASELRLASFSLATRRWERASLPGLDPLLPLRRHPLINARDGLLPWACWTEEVEAGSAIRVARRRAEPTDPVELETLDEPRGEHSLPQLVAVDGDRATLVWQIFAQGAQAIRLAGLRWGASREVQAVSVSPPTHRFASDPWHCSAGRWSMALWTDDHRDGGTGEIGMAEVQWPE